MRTNGYGFAIDRGGTFTDVYIKRPNGSVGQLKLLSEDLQNYADAPTEAIRRVLQTELNIELSRGQLLPTEHIAWIRMGTTVATNALLERRGARTALLITKGFKDLLYIGNQCRSQIFELNIQLPEVLYEQIHEIDERVILEDCTCRLQFAGATIDRTINDQKIIIEKAVNVQSVRELLQKIFNDGIQSIAVAFLHSYKYPNHEQIVGAIAAEVGFTNVSLSSDVMPMIKIVPRGHTACADAYLTPKIQEYIASFKSGFVDQLNGVIVEFMQSDGGLCPVERFFGSRAILSGPAAGVVGVSLTAYSHKTGEPVIGFDMGGTSTDVCRYAGEFEHVVETTIAGVTIQAPQLAIHTVAAGGGSRLFFSNGIFVVGPESSGANPGPICYRKNGYLSLTDANVVLGRIVPEYFPKIFGPTEAEPIDKDAAVKAMKELACSVNLFCQADQRTSHEPLSVEAMALGFVEVANESMCRAIRSITQAKGHDTSKHILACFGSAGGQHACAIAKSLGIKKVIIHRYAGILSAYGLYLADVVHEAQKPVGKDFNEESFGYINERITSLASECGSALRDMGFSENCIRYEIFLHMRYARTDCAIMCTVECNELNFDITKFRDAFESAYQREFGFILPERTVIVDDVRVRGIGMSGQVERFETSDSAQTSLKPTKIVKCFFREGLHCIELDTSLFEMKNVKNGHRIQGPSIIVDASNTILIEPLCEAVVTSDGDLEIAVEQQKKLEIGLDVDPIQLSIFSHRFMSIAEQMGRVLQRTAISTNIKERLDFSCALFGPDGGLVANAPHIPVHLGGMQATVKYQLENTGSESFSEGDVILCNHPKAGGSHLPDLTVITPVYYQHSEKPVFFVANRGHHADIGGLVPGSMPPHSTSLEQEGATFVSFKIVKNGVFQEDDLIARFKAPGKVPGCSGSRNLSDNLSDLRAQIAANQKGIHLVCELVDYYGLETVQAYMEHIQHNAELGVRELLREVGRKQKAVLGRAELHATDYMDDGTAICLSIKIDEENGKALFNFDGTGMEVLSSSNAPGAVVVAAILYCLRCLVATDIPLNQGCLTPITIEIPPGTILSPHETAAVVGGNVLTSQRICDVIFRAFGAVAASQGCMNNVSFGDDQMGGYYETVAGGAGAGPGFHGRSAVHTHMTNTRITDPEILESRYPVILREFGIRDHSGGRGLYRGGDGCKRSIQFRRPLQLSVLSERRVFAPYGLDGGEDGQKGLNLLKMHNGRTVNLGGKRSMQVQAGDIFELLTPGGGGYGNVSSKVHEENPQYILTDTIKSNAPHTF